MIETYRTADEPEKTDFEVPDITADYPELRNLSRAVLCGVTLAAAAALLSTDKRKKTKNM